MPIVSKWKHNMSLTAKNVYFRSRLMVVESSQCDLLCLETRCGVLAGGDALCAVCPWDHWVVLLASESLKVAKAHFHHWRNEESPHHHGGSLPEDTCIVFSGALHLRGDPRWGKPLQLRSIANHIYLLSCAQSQAGPSHRAKKGGRMQHGSLPASRRGARWLYSTNQSELPHHLI